MNNKITFFITLIICNSINVTILSQPSYNNNPEDVRRLKKELQELLENKSAAEMRLNKFKEFSSVYGYVGREVKRLYEPLWGEGYSAMLNPLIAPWEGMRIIGAYVLFPITIPVFAIGGVEKWSKEKKDDEERLKRYEQKLQSIDEEVKKTEEKINLFEN